MSSRFPRAALAGGSAIVLAFLFGGAARSQHKRRLAIDLLLFKDGKYLTDTKDYAPLGLWWEQQGGAWGGRFEDGNHFSLAYQGAE